MEHIPPKGTTSEEFTDQFVVKKNDVQSIRGKPTYTSCKPILDAVEMNLINMLDPRDNIWGKLHLVANTQQMQGGPVQQIVRSTNQGQQLPYIAPTTARERQNYLIAYHQDQGHWLDDQAAEEVLKEFILSRVDEVYLEALYEPRIRYKGKTLRQFMDVLIVDFQATPEERAEADTFG